MTGSHTSELLYSWEIVERVRIYVRMSKEGSAGGAD